MCVSMQVSMEARKGTIGPQNYTASSCEPPHGDGRNHIHILYKTASNLYQKTSLQPAV